MFILLSTNCLIFGYLIKIAERLHTIVPGAKFDYYFNDIWYAFITMTTVGYGDLFPETNFGRIIGIIIGINGIFINSLLTVILNDVFTFVGGELKSYNVIKTIIMRESLSSIVVELLRYLMLYRSLNKKLKMCKQNARDRKNLLNKLNKIEVLKDSAFQKFKILSDDFNEVKETDELLQLNEKIISIKQLINKFLSDLTTNIKMRDKKTRK